MERPVPTISLRPIGSPIALAFLALAGGTFVLSGLQLHWIANSEWHATALVLLAFVFPAQLLASVYGFLARDSVAGTGVGILSVTWLAVGAIMATGAPGATSGAAGLLLLLAATALLVPVVASGTDKLAASAVLLTAAVRFYLTGAYELSAGAAWARAAGIAGLVLTAVALYAALAFELEDNRHRTVLPTLRSGAGARALDDDPATQLRHIAREAGVRREL